MEVWKEKERHDIYLDFRCIFCVPWKGGVLLMRRGITGAHSGRWRKEEQKNMVQVVELLCDEDCSVC